MRDSGAARLMRVSVGCHRKGGGAPSPFPAAARPINPLHASPAVIDATGVRLAGTTPPAEARRALPNRPAIHFCGTVWSPRRVTHGTRRTRRETRYRKRGTVPDEPRCKQDAERV